MHNFKTWKVRFFQTTRGNYPVKDFIQEQDAATYAKTLNYILLLKTHGSYLKPPYIKKMQSNLYELRVTTKISIRILYTMIENEYYLLHAFKKKTQKTPLKEIKTAIDRMKEIL